jgi:hypothetical protein
MKMTFQHSQPESVYRQKNRAISGLMIVLSLVMFAVYGIRFFNRPDLGNVLMAVIWPINLVNFAQMVFRNKLVMSPAGITVLFERKLETAWSNVERIQLLRVGIFKADVPCLILREPVPGKTGLAGAGVPAELKGRVIPLHPAVWERMFSLEDELYGYLRANSVMRNELAVPINFAAINQRQIRFAWKIGAAMFGLMVIISAVAFMALRIF